MNYMKELNAFREWLLVNDLSASAIVLWYTLMSINNMTMWKERFNASSMLLQKLTGLSKSGVLKARHTLVEHGLIECENGKRGKAPVFKMISLIQQPKATMAPASTETKLVGSTVSPSVISSVKHSSPIHRRRQDETKKKTKNTAPALSEKTFKQKNNSFHHQQQDHDLSIFDEMLKEVSHESEGSYSRLEDDQRSISQI